MIKHLTAPRVHNVCHSVSIFKTLLLPQNDSVYYFFQVSEFVGKFSTKRRSALK